MHLSRALGARWQKSYASLQKVAPWIVESALKMDETNKRAFTQMSIETLYVSGEKEALRAGIVRAVPEEGGILRDSCLPGRQGQVSEASAAPDRS